MSRTDVIGLDEVVQKLQVRRLKVRISTIGPTDKGNCEQDSFYNPKIKNIRKNKLNRLHFTSMTFKEEISRNTSHRQNRKAQNDIMQGGKVDDNR